MRILVAFVAVACSLVPGNLDARCHAVSCQAAFVVTPVAVALAVPVAEYAPVGYSYTPTPQPVQVTVNLNADDIANRVVQRLTAADQQNQPPLPSPPPVPQAQEPRSTPGPVPPPPPEQTPLPPPPQPTSMVSAKCMKCHQTADEAKGKPSFAGVLDCPTRLKMISAIVTDKMPKGGKLTPEEAGAIITELSK